MQSSRIAVHASRQVRINTPALRSNARRFAEARSQPSRPGQPDVSGASSGGSSSSGSGSAGPSHGLAYGLAGGFVGSAVFFYAWYQISGVGKAARTMKSMKQYVDSGIDKLKVEFKENTPEPNEAIDTLKRTAQSYATFIPGGRDWVDAIFKDIDIVRHNHAQEVDEIAKNAYEELRDTTKKGLNMETASQAWEVMSKYIQQLASLAVDAGQDILNNHPDLKNKLGGSFDQLKQMGDTLGPEAKKQVDETYQEIKDVINQGLTFDTVPKVQKLVQDKVQSLRQLGDQAWQKGYEQVKPMLSNNPKVKEVVEQNIDTLKNGNVMEALEKVRQSLMSGDSSSLEQYIQAAKKKGEQYTSGNFSNWFQTIPSGSHILEQLQKLKQGAESQAPEAEKVARDTFNDIKAVLEKRSKQIEEVYEKAKKEGGAK